MPIKRRKPRGGRNAHNGHYNAADGRENYGGLYTLADVLVVVRAVILRDNDRSAGAQTGEEADDEVQYLRGGAADGGKRVLADEAADDHGVGHVIQLLEQHTEQNREEEVHQLLEDAALGYCVVLNPMLVHIKKTAQRAEPPFQYPWIIYANTEKGKTQAAKNTDFSRFFAIFYVYFSAP